MRSPWTTDRESLRTRAVTFILWGVLLIVLGMALLAWPNLTGTVLMTIVGVFLAAAGAVLLYSAWRLRPVWGGLWVVSLVPAVALMVFGIVVLTSPDLVSTLVLTIVAVLAVIAGLNDLAGALAIARVFSWWWLRLLRGLLLIGAGVWVIVEDISGLAVVGVAAGAWSLVLGALSIVWGVLSVRD
ncbi:HdeD family acid-resistance protein [Anaerosoma tenue]|uniref:HdeD family acid-resistance protein n=1 Tax=Anaerosoma tenue TaxID=2933588 RepID=UPI0022609BAA|nr:DUF308 domain-containing protein [Anaerosoma tenue]MCK8115382.1 DUF308 domain-containing protein [Anaerosoma tenue]